VFSWESQTKEKAQYVCHTRYKHLLSRPFRIKTGNGLYSYTFCTKIYINNFEKKHFSDSFISSNLIHNSYINYLKLNASTSFERHPPILRRSMSLIVHVCSLWYSHSLQVVMEYLFCLFCNANIEIR